MNIEELEQVAKFVEGLHLPTHGVTEQERTLLFVTPELVKVAKAAEALCSTPDVKHGNYTQAELRYRRYDDLVRALNNLKEKMKK